jgi:hypothetical protein
VQGETIAPDTVATLGSTAYWGDPASQTILAIPVGGGVPSTLATGVSPIDLAVDPSAAYWLDGRGGVLKVGLDGGAPVTLASLPANAPSGASIAVDATNVYWTYPGTQANGFADGLVESVPLGGGATTTLASAVQQPSGITVDSTNVYWVGVNGLMAVSLGGGATETLAALSLYNPAAVAVDSANAYVVDDDSLRRIPLAGGTVTTVSASQPSGLTVLVDATSVYFSRAGSTGAPGAIVKVTPK